MNYAVFVLPPEACDEPDVDFLTARFVGVFDEYYPYDALLNEAEGSLVAFYRDDGLIGDFGLVRYGPLDGDAPYSPFESGWSDASISFLRSAGAARLGVAPVVLSTVAVLEGCAEIRAAESV